MTQQTSVGALVPSGGTIDTIRLSLLYFTLIMSLVSVEANLLPGPRIDRLMAIIDVPLANLAVNIRYGLIFATWGSEFDKDRTVKLQFSFIVELYELT